ncbi:MAG: dienelactone hydrolase family protein [Dehalococcoidia bacterium]|nr:dienelactone hydrolase family protein [Dehalococcoidia bacterium]
MYEGMLAETIRYQGHGGDTIEAYYARPLGAGPWPGVVVIHHGLGWDEWTREVVEKLARHGYATIAPSLWYREAPNASPDDAAAVMRAQGGEPDDRCIGDVATAMHYLKAQPYSNQKVGVIGFCSGGRQTYLVACRIPELNAAVDCWGGNVAVGPDKLTERQPMAPFDMTADLACPLLGLFGNEDPNPDADEVNRTEAALKQHGKTYEFHRYDGAGHAFFATHRPAYRVQQALDAWERIFTWYGKYLR